ncbi:MAG: hypothetical protein WCK77_13555 [Verrucomicrobiota bacterium]
MKKTHTENDDLRNLIDEIARRRLPDRVLGGILAGKEDGIRHDAAIMLLQGFLLGNPDFVKAAGRDRSATTFHLERGVSITLKYCMARLMRREAKEKLLPG